MSAAPLAPTWSCSLLTVLSEVEAVRCLLYVPVLCLGDTRRCSTAKSSLGFCDPRDCSTPGFPVLRYLSGLAQMNVHWVSDAIQPSYSLSPQLLPSFPASGSFLMNWLFISDGQSIGDSASASVLSVKIHSWFPLRLTGLISLHKILCS